MKNNPFEDYKVYGPYLDRDQGRKNIQLVRKDNWKIRTTISYAKYLLSLEIGYWISREEEVDHKDGDKTNDSIDNLQILTHRENARKDHPNGLYDGWEIVIRAYCQKEFSREAKKLRIARRKNRAGPYCSHRCSGKVHH